MSLSTVFQSYQDDGKVINKVCLFVLVQHRFQQFFSRITMMSGCDRELNAHFYSAASLEYHGPEV